MEIEILIAFAIVLPAILLAWTRSSWLLDYAILVIAFNRLIRRLIDYYVHEEFNPYSLISLTPLVVACLLIIPAYAYFSRLDHLQRRIILLFTVAIGYGFTIGFIFNGFSAIYSLGEWLSGLAAFAFAMTFPASERISNRWIRSAGWCAIGVALYGWWQYFTIPEWDAFWVRSVGFEGYLGNLVPTEMSVFSTMNSRGPAAGFLAWAAIPMLLDSKWRNWTSWLGVLLILSCIMLTMTRATLIIIAVVVILNPLLTRGKGLGTIITLTVVLVAAISFGLERIPGTEKFEQRYSTLINITADGSFQGRLKIYQHGLGAVSQNPIGYGLGSSGLAGRVSNSQAAIGDSGYIQIIYQFGWIGSICFFYALYLIWTVSTLRYKWGSLDSFVHSSRAILIGCMVFLYVGDIFAGFSIFWIILGRALSPETAPDDEDTAETKEMDSDQTVAELYKPR